MEIARYIVGAATALGLFWLSFRAVDDEQLPAPRWSPRDLLPSRFRTDP